MALLGSDFDSAVPPGSQAIKLGASWIRDIKARLKAWATVMFDLETGLMKTTGGSPGGGPVSSAMLSTITGLTATNVGTLPADLQPDGPGLKYYRRIQCNDRGQVVDGDNQTVAGMATDDTTKLGRTPVTDGIPVATIKPSATASQLLRTNSAATSAEWFTGLTAAQFTTSQGAGWMERTVRYGDSNNLKAACGDTERFCVVGDGGGTSMARTSADGSVGTTGSNNTWLNQATGSGGQQFNAILFSAGATTHKVLVVGNSGLVWSASDTANIAPRTPVGISGTLKGIAHSGGGSGPWVVCGNDGANAAIWTTGDITGNPTFSAQAFDVSPGTDTFNAIIFNGSGQYVAVGTTGRIYTWTGSGNWIQRTSGVSVSLNGVSFGNGVYVAVGNATAGAAVILTSTDGVTWTPRTSGVNADLKAVAFGNGVFVAVGGTSGGVILSSPDGVTWTNRSANVKIDTDLTTVAAKSALFFGVAFARGTFLIVGNSGTVLLGGDLPLPRETNTLRYLYQIPHALGGMAHSVRYSLVCVAAHANYAVGEEVNLMVDNQEKIWSDSTCGFIWPTSPQPLINVRDKGSATFALTGVNTAAAVHNWKLRIVATRVT